MIDLSVIRRLATQLGAPDIADRADALAQRLAEGRFYVACVGQFKRGKSTLLNGLVGDPILPTGVVPVTSVVTVLRYGERRAARVKVGGSWAPCDPSQLADFVSEDQNPGNRRAVEAVEVFVPSQLLAHGMCLVDTPGVGSVFEENSAATHAFVPHVDAALVVLGADPPVSAAELRLVGEIAARAEHLVFVLNKVDRVSERERSEAAAFCERLLRERLGKPVKALLQVSATEALWGNGPGRDWSSLVGTLEGLGQISGAALVRTAEARGARLLASDVRRDLDEHRRALERPLEESQARVATLRAGIARAEELLGELGARLSVEQSRISRILSDEQERFLAKAVPAASAELARTLRLEPSAPAEYRQRALALAVEVARSWIERWRRETQPEVEERYRKAANRFIDLAVTVQADMAQIPGLEKLPTIGDDSALPVRSRFHFTEILTVAPESVGKRLLDRIASSKMRVGFVDRDAAQYLEQLLQVNGARIRNDFEERVLQSRRRLERDLRARLDAIAATAERSLQMAEASHAAGSAAVAARLAELQRVEHDLVSFERDIGTDQVKDVHP
jgi:hypothetical protein